MSPLNGMLVEITANFDNFLKAVYRARDSLGKFYEAYAGNKPAKYKLNHYERMMSHRGKRKK